jgi:protein pelota
MKAKIGRKTKLQPQSVEDLWLLTKILSKGDLVEGNSFRRFKTDKLRAESGEKKPVRIKLRVENVEFSENSNKLRITGVIVSGYPEEFVQIGEHHTLDLEEGSEIEVEKEFGFYEMKMLKEAKSQSKKIIVVLIDESEARLFEVGLKGVKFLFEIENHANKRDLKKFQEEKNEFLNEVASSIKSNEIVIAGPGFMKNELNKKIDGLKKTWVESTSTTEITGVYELIKKGVLNKVFGELKIEKEFESLEEFKRSVGKDDGLSCYGLNEVESAVEANSVKKILITDELLRKNNEAEKIIRKAESKGAEIIIFDSEDEAGREFKNIQIAALLRFKVKK